MALSSSAISSAIKSSVAGAMPGIVGAENFQGLTPEFEAVVDAITVAVVNAVNIELTAIKTAYNSHIHVTGVGNTTPPAPPMA